MPVSYVTALSVTIWTQKLALGPRRGLALLGAELGAHFGVDACGAEKVCLYAGADLFGEDEG